MTTKTTQKARSQKVRRVLRTAILCSVSTLAVMAGGAYAQDAAPDAEDVETVVVTGVRGSLQRSMNIKRNASGVVDAISAEDIGKYPDTNLAESVQRIPGVSIDRVNGAGSTVTVRGFGPGFNLVTLNGRSLPTASIGLIGTGNVFAGGGSRNFDFSNIASDGVTGFEVYKTGKAHVASGGIGATLNIKTLRPLARPGTSGSLSVKALHGEGLIDGRDWTPEISGAYSWSNDDSTFGVSIFGQLSERDVATRQAVSNAWNLDTYDQFFSPSSGRLRYSGNTLQTAITNAPPAGSLIAYPNDSRYAFSETTDKRKNLQAVVQWKPSENLIFTADALIVNNEATENRAEQTNWFNRPFDQITFVKGDSGIYNAVYLQENLSGVKDIGFEQQLLGLESKLTSIGLNAQWNLNDQASLTFDVHSSKSEVLPNNPDGSTAVIISIGAPVISSHSVDYRGDIPVQTYTINDALRGNNNGRLDAGDLGSQVGRTATNSQSHQVDEIKVDFAYEFDDGSRFDAGVSRNNSELTTTTGSTYQALGDWGISNPGDVNQYAGAFIETYDLGGLFNDFTPGQAGIAFRGNALDIYTALAKSPLYNVAIPNTSLTANTVEEDITAVYGQVSLKGEFLGRSANVVAGIRYEKTEVTASALQSIPTAIRWTADNDFTTDFGTGISTVSSAAEYDNWLPNLDISWNYRDDVIVRASFSKTIARPAFGNLFATTTVNTPPRPTLNGTNPTAGSGNPGLLPLESSNVDFSVEWYYGPTNYVSAGFYNKDVANFVGTGRVQSNWFDLRDPSSGTAGSRSGTARTQLGLINQSTTDVNLFTYTALLVKHSGSTTLATSEYQANSTNGNLNQAFVDTILAQYDITANSSDPLFVFDTNIPVNNKTANLNGFELAFQHFFGDTGFGAAGSLTTVNGDIEFDNSAPAGTSQFPLLGLSNTFNITAIYDKGPLSGRLSYNWRDTYIANTNIGAQTDPLYVEPFGVVDVSVNYQATPSIQLTLEGLNLTKEHIRHYGRDKTNLYFAQELDTRYQVGLRYKF